MEHNSCFLPAYSLGWLLFCSLLLSVLTSLLCTHLWFWLHALPLGRGHRSRRVTFPRCIPEVKNSGLGLCCPVSVWALPLASSVTLGRWLNSVSYRSVHIPHHDCLPRQGSVHWEWVPRNTQCAPSCAGTPPHAVPPGGPETCSLPMSAALLPLPSSSSVPPLKPNKTSKCPWC